ncbi:Hypothetical predicted protein [Pelobates cultripes]|uniref:Uncharacterized protein n=1 Tax=Pelobates cultripes TaxID=61616 RepID=A0AAD1WRC3_PELCU|nr:Hypothetical predicted protein [Pelobates cultripes]
MTAAAFWAFHDELITQAFERLWVRFLAKLSHQAMKSVEKESTKQPHAGRTPDPKPAGSHQIMTPIARQWRRSHMPCSRQLYPTGCRCLPRPQTIWERLHLSSSHTGEDGRPRVHIRVADSNKTSGQQALDCNGA